MCCCPTIDQMNHRWAARGLPFVDEGHSLPQWVITRHSMCPLEGTTRQLEGTCHVHLDKFHGLGLIDHVRVARFRKG